MRVFPRFLLVAGLLLASVFARAELSQLAVTFAPAASIYNIGEVINVTAASNGTQARYAFELSRVSGATKTFLSRTVWSSLATYQLDTAGMEAGTYRLRIYAREKANAWETLVKAEYFTLATASLSCENLSGKTLVNAGSAPWAFPGTLTVIQLLSALHMDAATAGPRVSSVSFDNGTVQVGVESFTATLRDLQTNFVTVALQAEADTYNGTYTCEDGVVSIHASGSPELNYPDLTLYANVYGDLQINGADGSIAMGAAVFR